MKYLVILLLLAGCATERQTVNPNHIAWSSKTAGYAAGNLESVRTQKLDVTVTMNKRGLLVMYIDGVPVMHKQNWCVEIVKYIPEN